MVEHSSKILANEGKATIVQKMLMCENEAKMRRKIQVAIAETQYFLTDYVSYKCSTKHRNDRNAATTRQGECPQCKARTRLSRRLPTL